MHRILHVVATYRPLQFFEFAHDAKPLENLFDGCARAWLLNVRRHSNDTCD